MAGDKISNDSNTTHLGIYRDITDKSNIEEKRFHWTQNSILPYGRWIPQRKWVEVCLNGFIWSSFVLPRLTYGLEVFLLRKKDFELLEKFQRKSLKQIHGLPDKTQNAFVLALLGIRPVEVTIHKNSLNIFVNIISDKASTEYQIAERQLAMKDHNEKSWFNYIRSILETYNMPSVLRCSTKRPRNLSGKDFWIIQQILM